MLFHILISAFIAHALVENYSEPALNNNEKATVYQVLEAINLEIDWKSSYPDNMCMGGPHRIVYDIDEDDK